MNNALKLRLSPSVYDTLLEEAKRTDRSLLALINKLCHQEAQRLNNL